MSPWTDSACKRPLAVEWHDDVWSPAITVRRAPRRRTIKPLPVTGLLPHPAPRHYLTKIMKPKLFFSRHSRSGFTLVELLVVIAIIAILASMTLAVVSKASVSAKKKQAKIEEQNLVTAIESYDSAYGRFPVSQAAQAAATAQNGDFTYGGPIRAVDGSINYTVNNSAAYTYNTSNSEVVAILMDLTSAPNGALTVNTNHVKNPRQTKFLNATMTGDPALPGVGPDLVYRDPWGNPYIISLDLNYDEQCRDVFYCQTVLHNPANTNPGLVGLTTTTPGGANDNYQFHGKVMVWSAGPDRKISNSDPATAGANKDNILSWQ
jgi:prepilin-type N-terminal cleavage/methylation domain-containing protein